MNRKIVAVIAAVGWVVTTQSGKQVDDAAGPFSIEDCQERAQSLEQQLRESSQDRHKNFHAFCDASGKQPMPVAKSPPKPTGSSGRICDTAACD